MIGSARIPRVGVDKDADSYMITSTHEHIDREDSSMPVSYHFSLFLLTRPHGTYLYVTTMQ